MIGNEECKKVVEMENVTADFVSNDFSVGTYNIYGIQIVTTGAGYTYDSIIEVTNTPSNPASWGPRPDTELTGNDDTSTPISIDFETGFSYARIRVSNVTGTIGSFLVTKNK